MIGGLVLMLGAYAAGATASLLARRSASATRALGHFGLCVGALAGVALAIRRMTGGGSGAAGHALRAELPSLFPFAKLSLVLDGLGAFFLLVVSIVAVAAAVYGPAYLRAHGTGSPAVEVLGTQPLRRLDGPRRVRRRRADLPSGVGRDDARQLRAGGVRGRRSGRPRGPRLHRDGARGHRAAHGRLPVARGACGDPRFRARCAWRPRRCPDPSGRCCSSSRSPVSGRKRASYRCTSGCPWHTRPRRATSRR